MKRFIFSILVITFLLSAASVEAGKKDAGPQWPSAADQQAFTERYWNAVDSGNEAHQKFVWDTQKEEAINSQMLGNLEKGLAADGSEAKGFRGDPNDQGPMDMSDWNVESDADGNVTGFSERDKEEKDTNHDGEVSDEERKAHKKQKMEEMAERGKRNPDWDQDGDGEPDAGFSLDCWQCKQPPGDDLTECVDGRIGPCPGSCSANMKCVAHKETRGPRVLICHNCIPEEEIVSFCGACGLTTDSACNNACPAIACAPLDVDKESCEIIPTMRTRVRGSTVRCYKCMKIEYIEITYVVIIIETPCGRYILNQAPGIGNFAPKQVMALSKVTTAPDGAKQLAGFFPAGAAGMGVLNIASSMSLPDLAGLMQQGLQKGGKYSDDCFEKDFSEQNFAGDTKTPAGSGASEKNSAKAKETKSDASQPQEAPSGEFGSDPTKDLTTSGPVVACGEKDGKKALAILSASGHPLEFITQEMLKSNPNAVTEALLKAQSMSDTILNIRQQGIENFAKQKATSMVQSFVDKMAQKAGDAIFNRDRNKAAKDALTEQKDIIPNDPYFTEPLKKQKAKKIKEQAPPPTLMGSAIKIGGRTLGATASEEKEEIMEYQWGLHEIGYTPLSDPQSAWNFAKFQDKNVIIAVIDSGIDLSHPDIPQFIWTNENEIPGNGIDDDNNGYADDVSGWNFINENNDLKDLQGHGTFVAGIIAAKWNNGAGIAGINPGAVIMPLKVADSEGATNSFRIFRAIHYAVENGARIINISLGGRQISDLEQSALNYARKVGVFVAVASGNVRENISEHGPASANGAFAVGSLDFEGTRSTISNWGANNGIIAPGDRIVSLLATGMGKKLLPSLVKKGYYPQSGTSFSTPMVAATASLLLTQKPDLTPDEIEDILHRSADDMYTDGWDGNSGAGKLNASAALQQIAQRPLTLKITETRFNRNTKGQLTSIDVFVTARGKIASYVVEVGKGKLAKTFQQVAGPYTKLADHDWVARIDPNVSLRGSKEWILRIRLTDSEGKEHTAETLLELK